MTTIEVTFADICDGMRCSCTKCPIALAIQRLIAPYCIVMVKNRCATVVHLDLPKLNQRFEFIIPYNALRFIHRFDTGQLVHPFSFELDIPTHLLK